MKNKQYTVIIDVNPEALAEATGKEVNESNIQELVEQELGWVGQSGISVDEINPCDDKLKKGTKVWWKGGFGSEKPVKAKIESIEICLPNKKDGEDAESVSWEDMENKNVVVTLDNGHWVYGSQISKIEQ